MSSSPTEPPPGGDRLWVVLPVHNEAAAIGRVIAEWIPALAAVDPSFVLLVVDDGSTDATPAILADLAAADPRIRVLRQANQGHGAACLQGYAIATGTDSDAEWILQIDSDGQCDPGDFPAFWTGRQEHPVQLGHRRAREDGFLRRITSRLLALAVSAAAGRWIPDANVPFRLLRRDLLERALERLGPAGLVGAGQVGAGQVGAGQVGAGQVGAGQVGARNGERVELANAALAVAATEIGAVRWREIHFRRRFAGESHYRFIRMGRLAADLLRWLLLAARGPAPEPALWTNRLGGGAWVVLAIALLAYGWRNVPQPAIWFDEGMQIYTALGVDPMAELPATTGGLREVVIRNRLDQLDPGGHGVLLHYWQRVTGTSVAAFRLASALLTLAGLAAIAALARRWIVHPLAAPAAVGLVLLDPLVRELAVEVRPYALELAATFVAFWAADRLLERPLAGRAVDLGLALVALLGARYSGWLTGAALAGALVLRAAPSAFAEPHRRRAAWTMFAALLLPFVAVLVLARWSLPGLVARSSWEGGRLVDYFASLTAKGMAPWEALVAALRNLTHPAALAVTVAAALGLRRLPATAGLAAARSHLVRRAASIVLLLTLAAWRWHPWAPGTKWSFYLRLVAIVCLVRLAADLWPILATRRWGRSLAGGLVLGVILGGAWLTGRHVRARWDVAWPALERIEAGLETTGRVAVDIHPLPAVRYHYEYGSLRGSPNYPGRFVLPSRGVAPPSEVICRAGWLLSFESLERLEGRYPQLRFVEDPGADQLLRVSPRDGGTSGPCG